MTQITNKLQTDVVLALLSAHPLFYDAQGSASFPTFDVYIGHRISATVKLAWADQRSDGTPQPDRYMVETHVSGKTQRLNGTGTLPERQSLERLLEGGSVLRGIFSTSEVTLYRPEPSAADSLNFVTEDGGSVRLFLVEDAGELTVKVQWSATPRLDLSLIPEHLIALLDVIHEHNGKQQSVTVPTTRKELIHAAPGSFEWRGERCRLSITPSRLQRTMNFLCRPPISATRYARLYV